MSVTKSVTLGGDSPSPSHPDPTPADPDLAGVIAAWPTLAPALRAGIVAMVRASTPREG